MQKVYSSPNTLKELMIKIVNRVMDNKAVSMKDIREVFIKKNEMKVWILSKGRGNQPQMQTFLNVFLVKVKYCSKVLGHLDRPSWWNPIHNQYIQQKLYT